MRKLAGLGLLAFMLAIGVPSIGAGPAQACEGAGANGK
jgi:hypothetical protein